MERMILCFFAALAIWAALTVLASPIKIGLKLAVNTALGFAALWIFNLLGVHTGITLGLNALNAFVLALFGPAGLCMLLFLRWMSL